MLHRSSDPHSCGQPALLAQLVDLVLIELTNWRWTWRSMLLTGTIAPLLARLARNRGRFSALPFAGAWTNTRDLPAPEGETFQALYKKRNGER